MAWKIIYFIIAIVMAVLGIWNLAKKRFIFLSIASLIWFLIVLGAFIIPNDIMGISLVPGATIGSLATYLVFPVLLILAYFAKRNS